MIDNPQAMKMRHPVNMKKWLTRDKVVVHSKKESFCLAIGLKLIRVVNHKCLLEN